MALAHSVDPLDYPARYQFGQANAPCGGTTDCTDTCIQMLGEYWKEKTYPLWQIRNLAQEGSNANHNPCTGINYAEALHGLHRIGITWYEVAFGIDANFIASKVRLGPVLVGVEGNSYPADVHGHCGGYNQAEHGGRTQCNFHGAHAILAIGYQKHLDAKKRLLHWDFVTRDPNHSGSILPTFDRITNSQLNKAVKDLPRYTVFNTTFCIYPTRSKNLKHL